MLFFAFFLAIVGVSHISTGEDYYTFLGSVSSRFENWRIEIPQIPSIPRMEQRDSRSGDNIFAAFRAFVNFFVVVVNALISILNILILIINTLIQLIQFVTTFLFSMKDLISRLVQRNSIVVFR